jgi:neutral amino acid transport system ATP-binding protein
MPASESYERGQTSGGGQAALLRQDWPNPAAHAFDDVEPAPGVVKPDPILVADDVRRTFGGLTAVAVEHLEVQRGAITALIGPNGAGKTTIFNLLTNFDKPNSGRVLFDGENATGVSSHKLATKGMVRTFQLTKVLAKMSVLDNMMLAAQEQSGESMWRGLVGRWGAQEADVRARALEVLDNFNMTHMSDEFAGALSGGQRKLLEMARSLMADPKLIMLDEPMAGVNPALTQSLLGHVKRLRAEGITVMFVEHDMDVVADISDWVIVMSEGIIIAEGPPSTIGANPAVQDAYLGSAHAALTDEIQEVIAGATATAETGVDAEDDGDG